MALIYTLLKWKEEGKFCDEESRTKESPCQNPRCISYTERVQPLYRQADDGTKRCVYCDAVWEEKG